METLIPIRQIGKYILSNPSTTTIVRWYTEGCRGRVLGTVLIGGRRYTTLEMIEQFINGKSPLRNAKKAESSLAEDGFIF